MRTLLLSVGMFSALPVPSGPMPVADRKTSAAALRWLPLVGGVLGGLAALLALIFWRGHGTGSSLLGAVVIVAALALLTRGLHLDGLADVADGLGSRRPAEQALEIMKRSDIGPFGVAAAVLVLLADVAALQTVLSGTGRWQGVVVVIAVVGAARLAALWAAGAPAARPGGFGALVAGSAGLTSQLTVSLLVAAVSGGLAIAVGTSTLWLLLGLLAGQIVAAGLCRHLVRRFGGTTGDVFGCLIETATTASLLFLAAVVAWRGSL